MAAAAFVVLTIFRTTAPAALDAMTIAAPRSQVARSRSRQDQAGSRRSRREMIEISFPLLLRYRSQTMRRCPRVRVVHVRVAAVQHGGGRAASAGQLVSRRIE